MAKKLVQERNSSLWKIGLSLGTIAVLLLALYLVRHPFSSHPLGTASITQEEIEQAIQRAQSYLVRSCKEDGQFIYKANANTTQGSLQYNVIRHEGVIYSLGLYFENHPDSVTLQTMVRAGNYLRQNYMEPILVEEKNQQMMAIWTKPLSSPDRKITSAGTLGLGLVALCSLEKNRPKTIDQGELIQVGHFLQYLQAQDGSFLTRYQSESGTTSEEASLYYPGEAILGLVSLYEETKDPQWLKTAGQALAYLVNSRQKVLSYPPDCWALIATKRFLPYYEQSHCRVSREQIEEHAEKICATILEEQVLTQESPELDGGFDPKGRTTPTSTRLEGLLSALDFLPQNQPELRSKIDQACQEGLSFLLRAQIKEGDFMGGMPQSMGQPDHLFHGSEIRIDYVQHALSAFLGYAARLKAVENQKKLNPRIFQSR